jgi:two-component system NtrC family sensor kinase
MFAQPLLTCILYVNNIIQINKHIVSDSVKKHLLNNSQAHPEDLYTYDLQNQAKQEAMHEAMQGVLDLMEVGLERVSDIVQNISITKDVACNNKQSYDINRCIQAVSDKLIKELPSHVSVKLVLAKLPAIYIDTYKISQLLTSLLTNASQAIRHEGVISICSKQQAGEIEISVADTGCGIHEDLQEKIFDPCYTTQNLLEGTGLGLAISRDIATENGGSLSVSSTAGEGSVFTLALPISDIIIH